MVKRIATPLCISPNGDGRKDTARDHVRAARRATATTVAIVTAGGDELRRLLDDRRLGAGRHAVVWDGRDDDGKVHARRRLLHPRDAARARAARSPGRAPIKLETTPPRPRLQSAIRAARRQRAAALHGPDQPAAASSASTAPTRRQAARGGPLRGRARQGRARSGTAMRARAACGRSRRATTRSSVTVQNRALVAGSSPPELPPTRESAAPRTGVTFTDLDLAPPLEPIRAGTVARVTRRRAVAAVPLEADAAQLDPPAAPRARPAGTRSRSASRPTRRPGVYSLVVAGAGHRATAPIAVRAGTPAPVLVVLPAITWQGRNPYDGDRDGFAETLDNSPSVGTDRPFADGRPPAGLRGARGAAHALPRPARLRPDHRPRAGARRGPQAALLPGR